jgi:hypothetical protein
MVDAAKSGAEFVVGAQVERLLFWYPNKPVPQITADNLGQFTHSAQRKRCIGALLTMEDGSKAVALGSKAVVLSGGSINSPAVLLRSGLKNPRIGKNLHLHPCTYVTAYFDEQINAWDGPIMTAVSSNEYLQLTLGLECM